MLKENISALVDQGFSSIGFFARIKPGIYPDYFDHSLRVDFSQRQSKRVDAANYFRNWKCRHVSNNI